MYNRRSFLSALASLLILPSCTSIRFIFSSHASFRDSILKVRDITGKKFVGERFLRLATVVMVTPGEYSGNKPSLLSIQDYYGSTKDEIYTFANEALKLNREYLNDEFIIDDDDKLISEHGRRKAIVITKEEAIEFVSGICLKLAKALKQADLSISKGNMSEEQVEQANKLIDVIYKLSVVYSILDEWNCPDLNIKAQS
jgi:hypothetical protein